MSASQNRLGRIAVREGAILGLAAAASFFFVYHHFFYPDTTTAPIETPAWAFALLVAVTYLFIRMLFLVGGMFYPKKRPEYIVCPECGRELDDTSPQGVANHHRLTLTPKPTEREILAAIMLRKAIDDARRSAKRDLAGPPVEAISIPGDIENPPLSFEEFERILQDIDFSAGQRRGAPDRRPKPPERRP